MNGPPVRLARRGQFQFCPRLWVRSSRIFFGDDGLWRDPWATVGDAIDSNRNSHSAFPAACPQCACRVVNNLLSVKEICAWLLPCEYHGRRMVTSSPIFYPPAMQNRMVGRLSQRCRKSYNGCMQNSFYRFIASFPPIRGAAGVSIHDRTCSITVGLPVVSRRSKGIPSA